MHVQKSIIEERFLHYMYSKEDDVVTAKNESYFHQVRHYTDTREQSDGDQQPNNNNVQEEQNIYTDEQQIYTDIVNRVEATNEVSGQDDVNYTILQ